MTSPQPMYPSQYADITEVCDRPERADCENGGGFQQHGFSNSVAVAAATSSDGGSRKLPFDPADAAGVKSGTVTKLTGRQEGRTGFENGASLTPGSSMSFGSAQPIIAGQAPGPSETNSVAVNDSSAPASVMDASQTAAALGSPCAAGSLDDMIADLHRIFLAIPGARANRGALS